ARRIMITAAIHKSFRLFGLDIIQVPPRQQECPPDFLKEEVEIIRAVRPWTMTSPERIYALIQAVRYVSANCIAGAIVECGVWKGGSLRSEEHTSELQSHLNLVCRLLLEKKKKQKKQS